MSRAASVTEVKGYAQTGTDSICLMVGKLSANLPPIEALRAWMMLFSGAIDALVKTAMKSGDIRKDLEPFDLLRALVGVSNVATGLDWQESARRLVDILITGSRPM